MCLFLKSGKKHSDERLDILPTSPVDNRDRATLHTPHTRSTGILDVLHQLHVDGERMSFDEPTLFDAETLKVDTDPELKTLYRKEGTHASFEAAKKILPAIRGIKKQMLDLLEDHPEGLTIFQMSHMTGLKIQSVSPRPSEMISKGLIFEDGERPSDDGNPATVYKHIKFKETQ